MPKILLLSLLLLCGLVTLGEARLVATGVSEGMAYEVEEVAGGLGVVWGLTFIAENEILLTEREGRLQRLNLDSGETTPVRGAPQVWHRGQGGLLDVAVPADFVQGDWIYFTYSKDVGGQGATTLARARLRDDALVDFENLLVTDSATGTARHFGSRIAFDESGHVYFSIGDRGVRATAQDRSNHAGTIVRLHRDGSVPADNPFVEGEGLREIWCYGLRNTQGLFWDRATGRLWSNDHGPRGGDEINLIRPGANYGWPVVSHGKEYWGPVAVGEATSKPGMQDPVKVFTPSIAPGSLIVYSGKAFPRWRGHLFSGALALRHLNRVVLDGEDKPVAEERLLTGLGERIRQVVESPEGWLYFSTDSGKVFRIRPVIPAS